MTPFSVRAIPAAALVMMLSACGDAPLEPAGSSVQFATAPAGPQEFTALACLSNVDPGEVSTNPGSVVQVVGMVEYYQLRSDHPLIAGLATATITGVSNTTHPVAATRLHSRLTLEPTAADGTWEVLDNYRETRNEPGLVRGTGQGTGELAGLRLSWVWQLAGSVDVIGEEPLCPVAYIVTGTIYGKARP